MSFRLPIARAISSSVLRKEIYSITPRDGGGLVVALIGLLGLFLRRIDLPLCVVELLADAFSNRGMTAPTAICQKHKNTCWANTNRLDAIQNALISSICLQPAIRF
jgi:hypothetical protein